MKLANGLSFAAVFPVVLLIVVPLIGCMDKASRAARAVSRADQAFARGNFKEALAGYSEATRLDRLNGTAYLGVARADIRLGKSEQAEPALVRAIDTLHDWPSISECYVDLSNIYLTSHGRMRPYLDAAGGMASRLLEHNARSFDGHRIWAEVSRLQAALEPLQFQAGVWRRKALQEFATANQIRPDDPRVLFSWALTLRANGDLESAKAMYSRLLKLQPDNIWVLDAFYTLALEQHRATEAENYFQQVLRASSADEKGLFQIASDAVSSGRTDDAHKILGVLAERNQDPDRVAALFFKAGYPDQGVQVLQKAIARDRSKAHYHEETAQKLALLRKDSRAAGVAAACLARFPQDVPCRAVKLFEDYQSAARASDLEALQLLAARHPENPTIRLYLGRISQQKGKIVDARVQFNLGLSADPNNADLRLALADVEIMSGVPDAARADAQYLLREDPQNRAALEILNRTAPKTPPQ
jgi:tetratricopeptide (TPR) repeat protein